MPFIRSGLWHSTAAAAVVLALILERPLLPAVSRDTLPSSLTDAGSGP
jgi:hypothetical protein